VWDLEKRVRRAVLQSDEPEATGIFACAVSPDGRLLASGTETGLKLWSLETLTKLAELPVGHAVEFLDFHPDGVHVLLGGENLMYVEVVGLGEESA
jgi:hypothetical protein